MTDHRTEEDDSWADETARIQADMARAATESREYPQYNVTRIRVTIEVPEFTSAQILKNVVSPEVAATLDDRDVVAFVAEHFQKVAEQDVQIDYGPYLERVRAVKSADIGPAPGMAWPDVRSNK